MSKILNYAWERRYADEESEAGKVHKAFAKKLDQLQIPTKIFLERLGSGANLDRINRVSEILSMDDIEFNEKIAARYQKSSEIAKDFRGRGNEFYKLRHFSLALRAYNLSIVFAPPSSSPGNDLSLAYGNRSAVFFEMGKFASSLQDILRALDHGYSKESLVKLSERQAKCCRFLDLDLAEIRSRDSVRLAELIQQTEVMEEVKMRRQLCNDLFNLKSPHPKITAAEDYISIQNNLQRGRHVVTTKHVQPGTVMIVDDPYAKILLKELRWDLGRCHFCHKKTLSGVPCPGCVFAYFCTEECLHNSMDSYHKHECACAPYLFMLKAPRTLLLALRILTTLGQAGCSAFFDSVHLDSVTPNNQMDPEIPEILGSENGIYNSRSYLPIHCLISHPEKCKTTELLSYTLTSLTVTKILDQYSSFFSNPNDQQFKLKVASLLLLHMLNLPCNAHSLNELDLTLNEGDDISEKIRSTVNTEYGAGAFALLSLINHSCDPNIFRVNLHHGKTAVVSLRPLNPGDELLDNYGHHYALEDQPTRHSELLQNYYFECDCPPCSFPERWPLFPELKSKSETFTCSSGEINEESTAHGNTAHGSQCQGSPLVACDKNAGRCIKCGKVYDQKQLTQELNMKIDDFFIAHDQVLQNDPIQALPRLTSCLDFFNTHLERPFIRINETEETLKQAMNLICI